MIFVDLERWLRKCYYLIPFHILFCSHAISNLKYMWCRILRYIQSIIILAMRYRINKTQRIFVSSKLCSPRKYQICKEKIWKFSINKAANILVYGNVTCITFFFAKKFAYVCHLLLYNRGLENIVYIRNKSTYILGLYYSHRICYVKIIFSEEL